MQNRSGFLSLGLALAGSTPCLASAQEVADEEAYDVVLVLVDDLGWRDLACQGNDFLDTPHIDRLAAEGIRFTDAYASGPTCSPTRAALQSGQNQARLGITSFIPGHWRPFERVQTPRSRTALPHDVVTIAELLRPAGYATGYIGKWHLGSGPAFAPSTQGYAMSAVVSGPHLPGRFRATDADVPPPRPDQYRTEYEGDLAVAFVERHAGKRPYFLMVSPYAVHIPLAAMSDKVEKYRERARVRGVDLPHPVYAAMIEHVDDLVGRLVAAVEATGTADRTTIVVTSDNGGLTRRYDYRAEADDVVAAQAPLRGEKGTLFEGGIRVPLVVRHPGGAAGGVCREPVVTHDLYATCAALAGVDLPANQTVDGVSLVPLFEDPAARLEREALFWHHPHYHHDRPAGAVRQGRYKLVEALDGSGDVALFDLENDPGETRDLAEAEPARTAAMRQSLRRWRRDVVAEMPVPNPAYDPERAHEWWRYRNGEPVRSGARRRFPQTEKGGRRR